MYPFARDETTSGRCWQNRNADRFHTGVCTRRPSVRDALYSASRSSAPDSKIFLPLAEGTADSRALATAAASIGL